MAGPISRKLRVAETSRPLYPAGKVPNMPIGGVRLALTRTGRPQTGAPCSGKTRRVTQKLTRAIVSDWHSEPFVRVPFCVAFSGAPQHTNCAGAQTGRFVHQPTCASDCKFDFQSIGAPDESLRQTVREIRLPEAKSRQPGFRSARASQSPAELPSGRLVSRCTHNSRCRGCAAPTLAPGSLQVHYWAPEAQTRPAVSLTAAEL